MQKCYLSKVFHKSFYCKRKSLGICQPPPPPCHLFTTRYNPGYNPKCTKDVRKQHKSMLRIYFNKCIISIVQIFSTEKFKIFALYIFQHIFYGIIQIPFFINSKLSRSSETFANKKFDTFALIVDIFLDYIT